MNLVIFSELGYISTFLGVLLAIFGHEVRYLDLSSGMRKESYASLLKCLNVRPLSYEDVLDAEAKHLKLLYCLSSSIYREHLGNSVIFHAIIDSLKMSESDSRKFSLACEHHFASEIKSYAELILFINELCAGKFYRRVILIAEKHHFLQLAISQYCTRKLHVVQVPKSQLKSYLNTYGQKLRNIITFASVKLQNAKLRQANDTQKAYIQSVIYFPHKGIFFANHFIKDHYYNSAPESPFYRNNILHISLGESVNEFSDALSFYRDNNIPHTDLYSLSVVKISNILEFIRTIGGVLGCLLADDKSCNLYSIQFFFARYMQFCLFRDALASLPEAKIALVGFDILFPPMLSAALSVSGIKTIAVQERFIALPQKRYRLIFDYYFVLGDRVCEIINAQSDLSSIGMCEPIGPIRAHLIGRYVEPFPDKYKIIKKRKILILCLDWPSVSSSIINSRTMMSSHWKGNKRYYKDLIRLASSFPMAHFVIKGKDTIVKSIPVMQDIIDIIDDMPNIEFELDLDSYKPPLMAAMADLTVACHTSLVDELLCMGRQVITYDITGFPSKIYDYDCSSFIVRSYNELESAVERVVNGGLVMSDEEFNHLRRNYYAVNSQDPRTPLQRLSCRMVEIYNEL